MGQRTFGVLYGAQANPPADADDGWYDLLDEYPEEAPDSERPYGGKYFVGYWVAAGGSGKDGIPHLAQVPFVLPNFAVTAPYDAACKEAAEKWRAFAQWAKEECYNFDEPQLFLLETEVA
jgi:hypothetical protein